MKFLLVDDHVVFRTGLRQVLAEEFSGAAFGEASSGTEAFALALSQPWDLVLLDVSLPGRGGLETLADLRSAGLRLPVIMLSMHPESEFAVRALRAGAAGFLTKQSAAEELIGAIHKALAGGRYITLALAEKLAAHAAGTGDAVPHESLSAREFQTLRLLATGKTVKEIAAELSLSAKTVSTYRTRVLEKLSLKGNVDLTRFALQHRLVE